MKKGVIGAVALAAFALAACRKEEPAQTTAKGEAGVQRPAPAGQAVPPAAAPQAAPAATAAWVARGGAITVDEREFLAYVRMTLPEGIKGRSLEERRGLAQRLIVRKAAAADAEKRGFDKDPLVANAVMKWKFETYPALYWAQTVEKEVRIDDKELRAIIKPETRYLLGAMVFSDDGEGERRAREVQALLAAGKDFEALAREQSEGFLAAKGGDMGWVTFPNLMIEEKEAAVIAATPPGTDTQPLRTRLGWTIFRVRERQDADAIFAERKKEVLPELLAQRIDEAKARRLDELRQRASIHYPAELPGARAGAPAAVVNGYVFPADAVDPKSEAHGGVTRSVTPAPRLLERTIDTLLLVQESERIGIAARPEQQLDLALKRMDTLAQLQFRKGPADVVVTDAELRQEYQRYYTPDTYEFQLIVAESPERAAEVLRRVRAGEDFGALAGELNTGQLAKNRGLVPLGSPSKQPASIQAALPALKDGEVSGVLDLGGGKSGVVKRRSQQFFVPPPFAEVSDQIRKRLETQKRADQTLALAEEYSKTLNIVYNDGLLARL